jgi:hypothetical protein
MAIAQAALVRAALTKVGPDPDRRGMTVAVGGTIARIEALATGAGHPQRRVRRRLFSPTGPTWPVWAMCAVKCG